MDTPAGAPPPPGFRNPGPRRSKPRNQQQQQQQQQQHFPPYSQAPTPQMYANNMAGGMAPSPLPFGQQPYTPQAPSGFDQTPAGFTQSPPAGYPEQALFQDPMANMAMQYGQRLAGQGTDIVTQKLGTYMSTSNLKYYFAVDTSYVGRKLAILLCPFAHSDWSIQYNQDEPVAPRYEVNAPDLYIPVMAFVTFVLLTGVVLGTQNRFSPEQLGIQASTSLGWLIIEILAILLTFYLMNLTTNLKYLDLVACCGYKYVGMILSLLTGMVFGSLGYYIVLLWTSGAVAFFLVQTLRVKVLPHSDSDNTVVRGNKRRNYLLLLIAGTQPVLMWWLTGRIMFYSPNI